MAESNSKLTVVDAVLVAIFLGLSGWCYRGFLSPDPLYVNAHLKGLFYLLSTALKIGVPVAVLAIVALFLLVRRGTIKGMNILLLVVGLGVGAFLLLFVASNFYYYKLAARSTADYHTYLQIAPPEFSLRKSESAVAPLRIVCLGGSTTAWGDSKGAKWTEMLEQRLNGKGSARRVEVYNQGMEWYTSLHSLINYETNVRQYHPDVLIVMHSINDLMHNADFGFYSNSAFREDYGHYTGPATNLVNRHTFQGVIYTNFKKLWGYKGRAEITTETFPGIEPFSRNLRTIADLAAVDGTKVLFMTEPYLFKPEMSDEERSILTMLNTEAIGVDRQWTLKTMLSAMQQYNAAIKRLAGVKGAAVIDLEAAVPKSAEYFKDDVHYTDKSFPLIVDTLANELMVRGVFSPLQGSPRG